MMLALVKCLFWIIKRATETELVLAHLSLSLFTSQFLLVSSFPYVTGETTKCYWQRRRETVIAMSNSVKMLILY